VRMQISYTLYDSICLRGLPIHYVSRKQGRSFLLRLNFVRVTPSHRQICRYLGGLVSWGGLGVDCGLPIHYVSRKQGRSFLLRLNFVRVTPSHRQICRYLGGLVSWGGLGVD